MTRDPPEPLLPEAMADHDDGGVELGLRLPRREAAPELHRHADHVEEIPATAAMEIRLIVRSVRASWRWSRY